MEPTFFYPPTLGKAERYARFLEDFSAYLEGEHDLIAALANTSAALREAFGFFWVGFYLVRDEAWLSLGPFQGSPACTRIRHGRGVCGTAWAEGRTLVVPDVDAFPGHIACSSLSRSEVVVPLRHPATGAILGVLDIDSDQPATFDDADASALGTICQTLMQIIFAEK